MLEIWSGRPRNAEVLSSSRSMAGCSASSAASAGTPPRPPRPPAGAGVAPRLRDGNATRVLRQRPAREHCATAAGATSPCVFSANCTAACRRRARGRPSRRGVRRLPRRDAGDEALAESTPSARAWAAAAGNARLPGAFADETDADGAPAVGAFASVARLTNYDQTVIDGDGLAPPPRRTSGWMRRSRRRWPTTSRDVRARPTRCPRAAPTVLRRTWALRAALRSHTEACETARQRSAAVRRPGRVGDAEGGCDYRVEILTRCARSLPEWNLSPTSCSTDST